ncbi:10517_t:CDS:1 [Funneliformis geosporum]|uniref:16729_t:CDS:1 n=1 Tax=Funneliformis geosporum TaxID=1117311 RepID=A0A9W4SQ63_9GLOM|nr:10517_t:CDS:1 [Funneliformis geosporum]CAI2177359.1 16729_t:CDS:1 [Funneliformis geosporum]
MTTRVKLRANMPTIYNQNKVRVPDPFLVEQVINSIGQETLEVILRQVFLPIKELIAPLPKKLRSNKIPRPQNHFLIYRRDFQAKLIFEKGSQFASKLDYVSKDASKSWSKISTGIKNVYICLAQLAKKVHAATYPGYVYQPKKRIERINPIAIASSFKVSGLSNIDSLTIDYSNSLDPSLPILTSPADIYNNYYQPCFYDTTSPISPNCAPFNDTERENSLSEESFTSHTTNESSGSRFLLPQLEHCIPIYITDPYDRKMVNQLPLAF